ncbi:enoyl-CoA hydratase/isomerase family protein [Noviherbaspirillum humi]|nr:enoyl-CoA hydratase/isomerase family protein [Noviherbaspirillum humi]
MSQDILSQVHRRIGFITLNRAAALNSLSLPMIRTMTEQLQAWRSDPAIDAVVVDSSSDKAFCAGGDIRFFHRAGSSTPAGGSALLEDFFTEEYALNHLVHHYPKPYVALMNGIVMGGGMGIAQAGAASRLRVVTERTRMAMPEVNIGLFPDVGGSHFLSRARGQVGTYLALTGEAIGAADALFAGLADVCLPSARLEELRAALRQSHADDVHALIDRFAVSQDTLPAPGLLAVNEAAIERHFSLATVGEIMASLGRDDSPFARSCLQAMGRRSPLMMCVALEQLRRGAGMHIADCLRMERSMMRCCFEQGEALEGIRALVIDKDNQPRWQPARLDEVTEAMIARFFEPAWPAHAHPLRDFV